MALTDIVERARVILQGAGLGEKPPLRIAAANAAEVTSGPLVTFSLASSTEASQVKAGDILSVRAASGLTTAFVLYVTSTGTSTVTAVNGYEGTNVTGADSGDLDNAVLEQNAVPTEYTLIKHVEQVVNGLLYPQVFLLNTRSVTPDLSNNQVEVPAAVQKVRSAWQVIAGEAVQIPFDLQRSLGSTVSSTGNLLYLGAFDSSKVYLTTEEKYASSSTMNEDVEYCIAMGAAALAAGGDVFGGNRERAHKDSRNRGERDVSATLWRDFLTLRQAISDGLAEDVEYFEIIR